jgi:hypothetical protein
MGMRIGFREWWWRGALVLLCYGAATAVVLAASPEPIGMVAMPDRWLEYRWNLASDGKNVFVAVNYTGALSELSKNCTASAPKYPHQVGAVLKAQDGWLMASVRAANPQNADKSQNRRNSFNQIYVWQNLGADEGQPTWQLSGELSPPASLPPSIAEQAGGVRSFTDDMAIDAGDPTTLFVGARLDTDPPKPPVALIYRKNKKDWRLEGVLPRESVGLGDADGLCLATAKDQLALGYQTGGLAVYRRVGGNNTQWERRGHFSIGCDHAAFVGDQFFALHSGRVHQLNLVDNIWQPLGEPLVYREHASLFPYPEQFTMQDTLLAVSDSSEQQVHLYLRNAQPMQQWRRQTSLGAAKNPAQADGEKSFGRRLAMAQNHLFVVQRGGAGAGKSGASKFQGSLRDNPDNEGLAHFVRNPLDGSWSQQPSIRIADLAKTQRLLTLTLNQKTCEPEVDSRSDQPTSPSLGTLFGLSKPAVPPLFLGAIYVLR